MSEEPVGTAYDVTAKKEATLTGTDGKAYRYKSTTGNPTGSVVEGTTEVTYVYEEVKGSVVVKYVNEAGQEIKASETVMSEEPVGTAYDVTGKKESTLTGTDGKAYRYKSTTGNPTGSVVEGTTEVTYVYEEVKGSVVVKYVNESGQEIKASETVMSEEPVGTAYDVTGKKESTLTGTDGKAYRYKSTTGNPTGSVVEGTTEVTYVYEEVKGSVVVKYVNESGQAIKASETVMSEEPVGTAYDVTGKKESTLTGTDGKVYRYKSTTGSPSGQVTEGTTTIVYTYKLATGSVKVRYISKKTGESLSPDVEVLPAGTAIGTSYDLSSYKKEPSEFSTGIAQPATYETVEVDKAETGVIGEEDTVITYTYDYKIKNPAQPAEIKGSVIVKYINEAGEEIRNSITVKDDVAVGTNYNTTSNRMESFVGFDGKFYEYISTDGDEEGQVQEGTTVVTYKYKEIDSSKRGAYTMNYALTLRMNQTIQNMLPLTSTSFLEELTMTYKGQRITTTISRDYGNTILSANLNLLEISGKINDVIDIPSPAELVKGIIFEHQGKIFQGIQGLRDYIRSRTNGLYEKKPDIERESNGFDTLARRDIPYSSGTIQAYTWQNISYEYEIPRGFVGVQYMNEDGIQIASYQNVVSYEPVGTHYDTTSYRKELIKGYDGKFYRYVRTEGDEIGEVQEGYHDVNYYYKETTVPDEDLGSVVVKYVNEAGEEISPQETVVNKELVGSDYSTSFYRRFNVTDPKGKLYSYQRTIGSENGKVVSGTTVVTYVYSIAKGTVVVRYRNEQGVDLKPSVTVHENVEVGTAYDVERFKEPEITAFGVKHKFYYTFNATSGTVYEGTNEIVFYYREDLKQDEGFVAVRHLAYTDQGLKEISPTELVLPVGPVGRDYDVTSRRKEVMTGTDGKTYKYSFVSGEEKGQSGVGGTYISYYYEVAKTVTVRYISQKTGKELAPAVTIAQSDGITYSTLAYKKSPSEFSTGLKNPSTYQTVRVDGREVGTLGQGETVVTYYYDYDETPRSEDQGSYTVDYTFVLGLTSPNTGSLLFTNALYNMKASYKGQPLYTEGMGNYFNAYGVISGRIFFGQGKEGETIKNVPTAEEITKNIDIEFDGRTFHGIDEFKNFFANYNDGSRLIIDKDSEVYKTNIDTYVPATTYSKDKIVQLYQSYDYRIRPFMI